MNHRGGDSKVVEEAATNHVAPVFPSLERARRNYKVYHLRTKISMINS